MSLQKQGKWWLVGLIGGLLAGCVYLTYQADQLRDQVVVLIEQNQLLTEKIDHLSYVNDLAIEFSMDPAIVTLIDRYSRDHMKNGGPEWRLVKTPEFMSYIMLSLIYVESKGNTHAVGDDGKARGLTQIWASSTSSTCSKSIAGTLPWRSTPGIGEAERSTNFWFMVSHPKTAMQRKSTRPLC